MNNRLCLIALVAIAPFLYAEEKKPEAKKPQVEVCFVLDTTGSMSGLIEGAKAKIWTIANQIVKQKPSPDVKIALIAYRDRGDAYVTQRFDLTADIDTVFKNLTAFHADGGGDEPESVNQALDEAVNKITWSPDRAVLKVIFLVGDAPPHMDYAGEKQYPAICKEAIKKDLLINTVQCGTIANTTPIWKEIAKSSEGEYAAIAQGGNMALVEAPQDKEIAKLNTELGKTLIPVALKGAKWDDVNADVRSKQALGEAAPATVVAERAVYLRSVMATTHPSGGAVSGGMFADGIRVSTGEGELLDQINAGAVKLADLKDEQLPPDMRKMNPTERAAYVETRQKERQAIQGKITELNKARMDYLEAEKKKQMAASPKADSFDATVNTILIKQAEAKK
ncbi:MAG: von Willebrand factor, type [Phycisphaerales bacterium]|nr:von Willebrand factor, type [Phycisphaerales bacterium]